MYVPQKNRVPRRVYIQGGAVLVMAGAFVDTF
jgi:hypothetical protein